VTRLVLPDDPRASRLFEELNAAYFRFLEKLPPPVQALGRRRQPYLGGPDSEPFGGVPELNPVLAATPWLFWETFCGLDDNTFLRIAEAGACYVVGSIVLDHIVDGQADPLGTTALLHQALYEHGLAGFRTTFPSDSPFWEHFSRLGASHLAALSAELEHQDPAAPVSFTDLRDMAEGKVSPIVSTLAALCEASDRPELLAPIETSLNHIAVASQLLDDIGDWRQDIEAHHFTYFLAQLAGEQKLDRGGWPGVEPLQARVDRDWTDVEQLRVVLDDLNLSLQAVHDLRCSGWTAYVRGYQELTDQHLTQALARHLARVLRPLIPAG